MSSVARRNSPAYGLMALLCIAFASAGAFAMHQEFATYLQAGPIITRARQVNPDMTVGLSANSMTTVLTDCIGAMDRGNSLEMRYQGADALPKLLANCLATADVIAQRSPSLSIAWLTGAYAAILSGDKKGFNDRLRRSQLTAPNEQWLVDQRVNLAEDHLADLSPESLAAHDSDLRLMVSSAEGLANVARRWVREESFRDRIADIVETMPQDVQQRFITNLQRAVRNAGR